MQKETKELKSQSYKYLKECTKIEKMYMDYATIVVKIYGNEIYIKNIVFECTTRRSQRAKFALAVEWL